MRAYLSAFVSAAVVVVLAACSGDNDNTSPVVFENTHRCDELAAHPDDPGKFAVGVEEDKLIPRLAIKACQKAVAEHPGTPRFQFQLGGSSLRATIMTVRPSSRVNRDL